MKNLNCSMKFLKSTFLLLFKVPEILKEELEILYLFHVIVSGSDPQIFRIAELTATNYLIIKYRLECDGM